VYIVFVIFCNNPRDFQDYVGNEKDVSYSGIFIWRFKVHFIIWLPKLLGQYCEKVRVYFLKIFWLYSVFTIGKIRTCQGVFIWHVCWAL